jgi:hypothetical protein
MIIRLPRFFAIAILLVVCGVGNAFGQAFLGQTFKACGTAKSIKHAFTISGTVISGPPSDKKPIRSSEVTLYEAATPSDIPQDNLPGCAVASTRTNLRGQFEMKFSNSPNPAAVLYLVAAGGNAGHGSNPNIKLMSVIKIGSVSNDDGSAITPIGTISATINELTTAASAYVYSNFISDETEIRDNSVGFLRSGFVTLNYTLLVDVPPTGTYGSVIVPSLNTLANAISRCVTDKRLSPGKAFPLCAQLFAATNNPTDTLAATININKAPANNVDAIFNLGSSGPYTPIVSEVPTDWTLALSFDANPPTKTGPFGIAIDSFGDVVSNTNQFMPPTDGGTVGGYAFDVNDNGWETVPANDALMEGSSTFPTDQLLNNPQALAFDQNQNIWVTNHQHKIGSVAELTGTGGQIYGEGGVGNDPAGIAVDIAGNVWVAAGDDVGELMGANGDTGRPISPADQGYRGGGLDGAQGIAIDSNGDVWVTNEAGDSVTELVGGSTPTYGSCTSPPAPGDTGCPISPSGGYIGGGLNEPEGIAIDGCNNIWVADLSGNSVTELAGGSTLASDNCTSAGTTGSPISPSSGYTGGGSGGLDGPDGISIDAGGNVWVTNTLNHTFTEFVGAATPIRTPIVRCIILEQEGLSCKPTLE